LLLVLEVVHYFAHLLVEAHVEHSVGLVQADVAAVVQIDLLLLEKVAQPARSRHDAVHPRLQEGLHLAPFVLPPDEQNRPDLAPSGVANALAKTLFKTMVESRLVQ